MSLPSYQTVPDVVNEMAPLQRKDQDDSSVQEYDGHTASAFPRIAKVFIGGLAFLAFMAVSTSRDNANVQAQIFDKEALHDQLWGSSKHALDIKNKKDWTAADWKEYGRQKKEFYKNYGDDKKKKYEKKAEEYEKKYEELKKEFEEEKKLEEYQVPRYYTDQLVDHYATDTKTWPHRYYISSEYFEGPGNPMIVVIGGEGPVDEVFYPFVKDTLAKKFNAFVLQTEHRFYGTSIPTEAGTSALPTNDEFKQLLSPDQALKDYVRLIRHMQGEIGCSVDRNSPQYCPIITVGASYPGFLSAMMRFVYPDVVDMSYASSAPLLLYAQARSSNVYFDYVTDRAEEGSPGCAEAHKRTLKAVKKSISNMSIHRAAKELGICPNIPKYIKSSEQLAEEVTMMVGFANADFNMDYHPPGDIKTDVMKGCHAMQQEDKTPMERMADWLVVKANSGATYKPGEPCYDLHWDIPSGANATIVGADWSGMGEGDTANTWEFQCCKDLIIATGFGPNSMFLNHPFDVNWLTEHCQARFGVNPEPTRMVDNWHFDDLVGQGGSHILFSNGLQDAWSPLSYTEDLSDTIVAVNMPSGAHHSDLNECCSDRPELDDIEDARKEIAKILGEWIDEMKGETQV